MLSEGNDKHPRAIAITSDELFSSAEQDIASGNGARGIRTLRDLANRGHVAAQHNLAYLYDTGVGVRRNIGFALNWYRRAYRSGSGIAATNMAICYRDLERFDLALSWFKRAAARGDADAHVEIAKLYLRSAGGWRRAQPHLQKALSAPGTRISRDARREARSLFRQLSIR